MGTSCTDGIGSTHWRLVESVPRSRCASRLSCLACILVGVPKKHIVAAQEVIVHCTYFVDIKQSELTAVISDRVPGTSLHPFFPPHLLSRPPIHPPPPPFRTLPLPFGSLPAAPPFVRSFVRPYRSAPAHIRQRQIATDSKRQQHALSSVAPVPLLIHLHTHRLGCAGAAGSGLFF